MILCLIEEDELGPINGFVADILSNDKTIRSDLNPSVREAYGRYLFFADAKLPEKFGFQLSGADSFYNAYFWIVVFSKRFQETYGLDPGVDQQVFKVLEAAPPEVDWKVVEEIRGGAE